MTAGHGDLERLASAWARHVRDIGPAAARRESLREAADKGVRDALYARGLSLSARETIIDAMALRAEAIPRDCEHVIAGQAKVKQALQSSGLEEPPLSQVFAAILDLADNGYGWVKTPGAGDADRIPAVELVAREMAPTHEKADVPEKHVARINEAIARWLESRSAFEAELEG